MRLVLKRSTIRDWCPEDAVSLAKHANNRKIWLGVRDLFPNPYTIEAAQEFLQKATTEKPTRKFCIEVDGEASGDIGIRIGEDVHRQTAELGYWLGQEFWGKGVMSEAAAAFTEYCFENFQLQRIHAQCFANNPASNRVLEKIGFVFEGRLRKNAIKDGKVLDSLLYAKIKDAE
ncbi:MAG: GNAT family protein [Verrucomicrobiota bacterium]